MAEDGFEPKIMVFVCSWCPLGAVDTAVSSQLPPKTVLRVMRVLCAGMVDPSYVLKAFASGADGVLIIGCHPGNCHYISGNIKALRRFSLVRKLLSGLGVDDDRLRLEWIAHAEQHRYLEVLNELSNRVRALGPFCSCLEEDDQQVA